MDITAIDWSLGGATLGSCPLSALFLSFLVYGFAGWLWESTVCAMLNHGHFANSGFLLGPCCPIYGVGGLACWLLLRGIAGLGEQFVAAAVVCSVIEYGVGVLLEKTTGARFWDYSHLPLNLHGRICLYWACAFGLGSVLVCRVTEPAILGVLGLLPAWLVIAAAVLLAGVLVADAVFSLASWKRLSAQLDTVRADLADRINDGLRDASDSMLEKIPESAIDSVNMTHVRGRAVNAWLAEIGDAALESLRERAALPSFKADGREGLALAARRGAGTADVAKAGASAIKAVWREYAPHPLDAAKEAWDERTVRPVAAAKEAWDERTVRPVAVAKEAWEGRTVRPIDAAKEAWDERTVRPVAAAREVWETRAPHPVRSVRETYAGWAERMEREGHGRRVPASRMHAVRPVPSVKLRRRDLRFFNAFPHLRINRYEGVIRATDLADRARDLFRR